MNDTTKSFEDSTFQDTEYSDDEASSDGLEIDLSENPTKQKEIDIEDKRVLENIEEEIERQYDKKAAQSNLSAINVKNILRHVITNEHVWAMVRNADGEETHTQLPFEPKFTRAKAKELMKTQNTQVIPWVTPKPSEVHLLIDQELAEDSDNDEEYVPHEDESEDEKETTCELDSQPATPATPTAMHDSSTQTNWTEDGVFKIPAVEKALDSESTENIALRTRSKLSLSDTPLETIEEAFIPPDITTDMYDFECDDDDWRDFLTKFTKPLEEAVLATPEDDDEADPEYNILADEDIGKKVDREELREDRAVKVSKKELNTLMAELFEFSELFSNEKEMDKQYTDMTTEPTDNVTVTETTTVQVSETVAISEAIINEDGTLTMCSETKTALLDEISHSQRIRDFQTLSEIGQSLAEERIDDPASEETIQITRDQRLLFEQQLRQHVQMLAQGFVLSYENPVWDHMSVNFQNMLFSLFELAKYRKNSAFHTANLNLAIDFVRNWEELVHSDTTEVLEMKSHVMNTLKTDQVYHKNQRYTYVPLFPKLILEKITNSPVFMYPSLLPKIPYRSKRDRLTKTVYVAAEDELIAIGMEQFYPYVESTLPKRSTLKKSEVVYNIMKYMMPHRDPVKLQNHIKQMADKRTPFNPIQHFYKTRKAPVTLHHVIPLSEIGILPPNKRPPKTLPYQWRTYLYPQPKNASAATRKEKLDKPEKRRPRYIQRPLAKVSPRPVSAPLRSASVPRKQVPVPLQPAPAAEVSKAAVPIRPLLIVDDLGLTKHLQNAPLYIRPGQPIAIVDSFSPPHKKARIENESVVIADKPNDVLNITPKEFVMKNNTLVTNNNIVSQAPVANVPNNVITLILISDRNLTAKAVGQKIIYDSEQKIIDTICIDDNSDKCSRANTSKASDQNIISKEKAVESRVNNSVLPELNDSCVSPKTINKESFKTLTVNEENVPTCEANIENLKNADAKKKRLKTVQENTNILKSVDDTNLIFRSPKEISNRVDLLNYKFNSSIFQRIREEKDSTMLPSMPFLATPLKNIVAKDLELTNSPPNSEEDRTISECSNTNKQDELEDCSVDLGKASTSNKKDDEDELNALMVASTTMQQKNKRIQPNLTKKAKQMKEYNATLAMLCPEDKKATQEKTSNFAQAYYDKVQERLETTSPVEYQKFMTALSEHDETKNSVSNLYEKVVAVLSPKHNDLCEEFLMFLTPEQAQQIGKLVPHYMYTNMSLFLRKLELYYSNQPTQLRRIYNNFTELADNPDVTMEKIRSSILPLLKGNSLLIDWFIQMFPQEKPPENLMTDWEQLSCADGDEIDDDERGFETLTLPEVEDPYGGPNCICKCHSIADEMYASRSRHCIPCGTKFLQGRVYVQTGKGLRLANVSFNSSLSSDHSKRLSAKPLVRPKRKSENSPSKLLMSPNKEEEPRHSNESEDDVNIENNLLKKGKNIKSFRPNEYSQTWNRDEDKIILQTFQKNGDSQNVFKEIQHLLPGRTVPEIRHRFHVLMGLLHEMSSSKS